MDYLHICTAATIAHHGLQTAHEAANNLASDTDNLEAKTKLLSMRQILFRCIMLEIGNIADVANMSRALYRSHGELSDMHAELSKAFEFFKYLRNKFVGHFVPELTSKTFEWLPQAYKTLGKMDAGHQLILSWFALETVINTYTDPENGHKIFDSETDLNYPPDRTRFYNFMGDTVEGALKYSELLIEISSSYVDIPDLQKNMIPIFMRAGETKFEFITKKR